MNEYDDAVAVLSGKKTALEETISSYERQLAELKSSNADYRRENARLDCQLRRYLADKSIVDQERASFENKHLLCGELNLPSRFLKKISGATGFGKSQPLLNGENLRNSRRLQNDISCFDRRTQIICIAIVKTNDEIAHLKKKFGENELLKVSKSQTFAGLKLQLIKTSQELATMKLAQHSHSLSGHGVTISRYRRLRDPTYQGMGVSVTVRRFLSE